jgi:hypothetical protein
MTTSAHVGAAPIATQARNARGEPISYDKTPLPERQEPGQGPAGSEEAR